MVSNDVNNSPVTTTSRGRRDWIIRRIPVKVKGRSPRPYRVPKLISSIVLGVCIYLAVHLNRSSPYATNILLRRGERDLSESPDYANDGYGYVSANYRNQYGQAFVFEALESPRDSERIITMDYSRAPNPYTP